MIHIHLCVHIHLYNMCLFSKRAKTNSNETSKNHTRKLTFQRVFHVHFVAVEESCGFGKKNTIKRPNNPNWSSGLSPGWPKKRIEETFDFFMHAPLGSGGYSSIGRVSFL